jgi:hypothetical protein
MSGDDRVRHCQECQLNVYNLSEMTRAEAEHLIASREGRLCIRFYHREDGTILTRDCPRGLRALTQRVSRIAGAVLTAMMAVGTAFAQSAGQTRPQTASGETQPNNTKLGLKVVDASGAAIAGAKIVLTGTDGKIQTAGTTGSNGVALLSAASGSFILRVQSPGFNTYQTSITIGQQKIRSVQIVLNVSEVTGVIELVPLRDFDVTTQTTVSGDVLHSLPMR